MNALSTRCTFFEEALPAGGSPFRESEGERWVGLRYFNGNTKTLYRQTCYF